MNQERTEMEEVELFPEPAIEVNEASIGELDFDNEDLICIFNLPDYNGMVIGYYREGFLQDDDGEIAQDVLQHPMSIRLTPDQMIVFEDVLFATVEDFIFISAYDERFTPKDHIKKAYMEYVKQITNAPQQLLVD